MTPTRRGGSRGKPNPNHPSMRRAPAQPGAPANGAPMPARPGMMPGGSRPRPRIAQQLGSANPGPGLGGPAQVTKPGFSGQRDAGTGSPNNGGPGLGGPSQVTKPGFSGQLADAQAKQRSMMNPQSSGGSTGMASPSGRPLGVSKQPAKSGQDVVASIQKMNGGITPKTIMEQRYGKPQNQGMQPASPNSGVTNMAGTGQGAGYKHGGQVTGKKFKGTF